MREGLALGSAGSGLRCPLASRPLGLRTSGPRRLVSGTTREGTAACHAPGGTQGLKPAVTVEPREKRRSRARQCEPPAAGSCSAAAWKRTIQHILCAQRERASDTLRSPPPSAPPAPAPPPSLRSSSPSSQPNFARWVSDGKRGRSGTSRLPGPTAADACAAHPLSMPGAPAKVGIWGAFWEPGHGYG